MSADVVVVGGGLAGLYAASRLARAGQRVTVLEGARELGGRGRTQVEHGFAFNLGAHALYKAGAAARGCRSLGIHVRGQAPPLPCLALDHPELAPLPFTPSAAVSTALLTPSERWEVARFFASLALSRTEPLHGVSVSEWLSGCTAAVRRVLGAVVRVTTYANALDDADAGATLAQLQLGLRGVTYLDGGWDQLVSSLREVAREAGVALVTGSPAVSVAPGVVRTASGEHRADAIVLAVPPAVAARLTGSASLARVVEQARPVRAACLDVALRGPTDPSRRFGLGLDRPLYVSVHSDRAALAPQGDTLIHALVYGGGADPDALRAELEAQIDRLHPGWRERVVHRRWLPSLTVAYDLPRASVGGRRAPVEVDDAPGVFVVGDWVGDEGWLADAAFASAGAATEVILRQQRRAA